MTNKPKRPKDVNQRAKQVVDLATMDEDERAALVKKKQRHSPEDTTDQAAHKPGRRGGSA